MDKNKLKKGDCFLMKGATINGPMTLYHITDIRDDKVDALSIYVHSTQVQGLEYASEYDYDIPNDAIPLPNGTYREVKESMKAFVKEIHDYLRAHCVGDDFEVKVGGHYWCHGIETITEINGNKTKYNLFRIEPENISPIWTGEGFVDSTMECGAEISDEDFNEIKQRFNQYVAYLRNLLVG